MAKGGKKPIDLTAFAYGAGDFLVVKDEDLEVFVAVHTMIFKQGHCRSPYRIQVSQGI